MREGGPAQCCVWPVAAPVQAFVRAGVWRREDTVLARRGRIPPTLLRSATSPCRRELGLFPLRAMSCVRLTSAVRSYWNVLRSVHTCCLTHSAKQIGLREVAFLFRRGSGSLLERSQRPCGYRACLVHFGVVRFFAATPTEYEGTRRTESAARRSAFLREPIGFDMFSAGSTLGLRAPDCAKESSTLWTLFI